MFQFVVMLWGRSNTCTDEGDGDGVAWQQLEELWNAEGGGAVDHAANADAVRVPVQLRHRAVVAHIVQC